MSQLTGGAFAGLRQHFLIGDAVASPGASAEWVNDWSRAERGAADLRLELERVLSEDRG